MITFVGCTDNEKCSPSCSEKKISEDHMEIIRQSYYFQTHPENICDVCLSMLISNIIDYRVSSNEYFYTSSVYIRKIAALEAVTGIKSDSLGFMPRPDALVIDKYLDWIKDSTKIDVSKLCLIYPSLGKLDEDPRNYLDNYDSVTWHSSWNSCLNNKKDELKHREGNVLTAEPMGDEGVVDSL